MEETFDEPRVSEAKTLRHLIGEITNQLCLAVEGRFNFAVLVPGHDETVEKLQLMVNFVLDAARKALESVEEKRAEVTRSNEELLQFSYAASHDLKAPLRRIVAFAELLRTEHAGSLKESGLKHVDQIASSARQMSTLIDDLLEFAKVDHVEFCLEPVNSTDVLSDVLSILRVIIDERKAVVSAGPLPSIQFHRAQLLQIFQNLVNNAIKFNNSEPPIVTVNASQHQHEWIYEVGDNGIGIAPDNLKEIFSPFRRLHAEKKYPGSGVGLAICKKILDRYGGRIWVESQPGIGSRFYFAVPIKPVNG